MTRIEVKKDNQFCYEILLGNSFEKLGSEVVKAGFENRKMCIVTDTNVEPLYAKKVADELKNIAKEVVIYTLKAGEEYKTLNEIQGVYKYLIEKKFDRKDVLIALGGGVVGDMTGYTAATYLRGVSFIQIPTTLLSQVDSSIGGKTGVDFDSYKNMVGAFHMPSLVYMNLSVLDTLPQEQFVSGMGEIIKHGLIKDATYYEWLKEHRTDILEKRYEVLLPMIQRSCEIKRDVVEKDPTEQGERALLNFGHTLGHAVEKLKNFTLLHGICVGLGAIAAAELSYGRKLIGKEELQDIRETFESFGFPVTYEGVEPEVVVEATKSDKKMEAGFIKFILLKEIGMAFIEKTVTDQELEEATKRILK